MPNHSTNYKKTSYLTPSPPPSLPHYCIPPNLYHPSSPPQPTSHPSSPPSSLHVYHPCFIDIILLTDGMSNVPYSDKQGDDFIDFIGSAEKLKESENYKAHWKVGNGGWTTGVTMSKTTEVFTEILFKKQ